MGVAEQPRDGGFASTISQVLNYYGNAPFGSLLIFKEMIAQILQLSL